MEEHIQFVEQVINSQYALRTKLKVEWSTRPQVVDPIPQLLDNIDEQINLLKELLSSLQNKQE